MTTPATQTIKLLVIEDNAGDAEIVQAYLRKSSMVHEQTNVATLEQAKWTLSEQSFDAIMVDLNLPDSTGVATVEAVVAAAKGVPVVAMTGTKSEKLGLQCIEAGAQDFIAKSDFNALSLERSINFAMARQSKTAPP